MTSFKPLIALLLATGLSGCSSPPEPPQPDRSSKYEQVNTTMPVWEPNNAFIRSPGVSGNWQLKLADFRGDDNTYPPAFWFGLAHSSHILVAAGSRTNWFAVKNWLRNHGATTQVIEYRVKPGCYYCADIYLAR
ncbi:cag pathogenicity island Cag12 family protein [Pantoea ananatis]|uniref:cag pathogenicity island Cag12 family protein n=1 Tax=Pantoea ananas TaxID=553 RepID=UPI001B301A0D|nr:cag pathogenicity island Cag12 family protein [Pantoea ananatis]